MSEEIPQNEFSKEYSEEKFWNKVKKFALKAGKEVIVRALTLYFYLHDKDTPKWAKGVIVGALGYFIFPLDAIPDLTPVVGFSDDLGVLASAFATVAIHIKDEHRKRAEETWNNWFGGLERNNK